LIEHFTCFHLLDYSVEFGFEMDDDGEIEVYHKGKHFHGLWPFFFVFLFHEYYFIEAANKYINHVSFGNEDLEEQAVAYYRNLPFAVLKEILYDLTDDVVKARDWASKNLQDTEEHDSTIGELKQLLAKAGHMNVDAISITDENKGTQIKLNLKGKPEQKLLRRATALLLDQEKQEGATALQSRLSRRNSYKDYQRRADEAVLAEKAKKGPSSFTKLMKSLTSDVRAGLEWMKENGSDAGEEHAPVAKKFDVNLLKRNSMVDMDRPGVKKGIA